MRGLRRRAGNYCISTICCNLVWCASRCVISAQASRLPALACPAVWQLLSAGVGGGGGRELSEVVGGGDGSYWSCVGGALPRRQACCSAWVGRGAISGGSSMAPRNGSSGMAWCTLPAGSRLSVGEWSAAGCGEGWRGGEEEREGEGQSTNTKTSQTRTRPLPYTRPPYPSFVCAQCRACRCVFVLRC